MSSNASWYMKIKDFIKCFQSLFAKACQIFLEAITWIILRYLYHVFQYSRDNSLAVSEPVAKFLAGSAQKSENNDTRTTAYCPRAINVDLRTLKISVRRETLPSLARATKSL